VEWRVVVLGRGWWMRVSRIQMERREGEEIDGEEGRGFGEGGGLVGSVRACARARVRACARVCVRVCQELGIGWGRERRRDRG
jgi:hypothetical protein